MLYKYRSDLEQGVKAIQYNGCEDIYEITREFPDFPKLITRGLPLQHGQCNKKWVVFHRSFSLRLPARYKRGNRAM